MPQFLFLHKNPESTKYPMFPRKTPSNINKTRNRIFLFHIKRKILQKKTMKEKLKKEINLRLIQKREGQLKIAYIFWVVVLYINYFIRSKKQNLMSIYV